MNTKLMYCRIRKACGILGMLLPVLVLLSAIGYGARMYLPENFWSNLSISATYYITPIMTMVLAAASVVLIAYDGYSKIDNIITVAAGIFGLLIVLFPCNSAFAGDYVGGFFMVTPEISGVIHNISASIFFILLAFNSMFLFTRYGAANKDTKEPVMTEKKKQRNKVYRICAICMLVPMLIMIIPVHFFAKTFMLETVMLWAFGFSWLVKGGMIKGLNDETGTENNS